MVSDPHHIIHYTGHWMDTRVSLDAAARTRSTAPASKQTLVIQRLHSHYNELPVLTNVQGKLTTKLGRCKFNQC
jgi:hypothetical protein